MDNSKVDKKKLLRISELSIWLDEYDDIFSDFDSRPIDERSLSDDFLAEVRKMVREKPSGAISLKLLIPADKRKKELETVAIKNLHTYFHHAAASRRTRSTRASPRRPGRQPGPPP